MEGLPWATMQRRNIDDMSLAVVREYLHHKGLDQTLFKLIEEIPKTWPRFYNRAELAQKLHIAPLMRRNRSLPKPFQTVLETLVWNMLQKPRVGSRPSSAHPAVGQPMRMSGERQEKQPSIKSPVTTVSSKNAESSLKRESLNDFKKVSAVETLEKKNSVENTSHRPRIDSFVLKDLDDVEDLEDKCLRWLTGYDHLLGVEVAETTTSKKREEKVPPTSKPEKYHPLRPKKVGFKITRVRQPLNFDTAKQLRRLIFGPTYSRNFNEAWQKQAFTFRECSNEQTDRLRYGIIQKKGGPCGLVAVVQAFVLKHLIFGRVGNNGSEVRSRDQSALNVQRDLRTSCLAESIVEILWRAGSGHRAVVATIGPNLSFRSAGYPTDSVTEYIVLTRCDTVASLHTTVYKNINHFEFGHGSAISLLYSAILSRGIGEILLDMDERTNSLLGRNCSCSLELLNLLLVGYASSNMFDNHKVIADFGSIHRGVVSKSDIGFLTVNFDESKKIGPNLDSPSYPIWIVASESQYSLLFGFHQDIVEDEIDVFELHYYEGFRHHNQEVKLTVDRTQKTPRNQRMTMSPLDNCIMRKWRKARLEWFVAKLD